MTCASRADDGTCGMFEDCDLEDLPAGCDERGYCGLEENEGLDYCEEYDDYDENEEEID